MNQLEAVHGGFTQTGEMQIAIVLSNSGYETINLSSAMLLIVEEISCLCIAYSFKLLSELVNHEVTGLCVLTSQLQ